MVSVRTALVAVAVVGVVALLAYFREQITGGARFLASGVIGFGESVSTFIGGLGTAAGTFIASPIVGVLNIVTGFANAICAAWPIFWAKPAFCGGGGGASTSGAGQGGTGGKIIAQDFTGCDTIYGPAVGHQVPGALTPYDIRRPVICLRGRS